MKILVVNDDSIAAPGISLLAKAAAELGEVTVVAPAHQCSAMSQKLTLREVLAVEKVEDFSVNVQGAYRLDGTPVDCVKVALDYILDDRPDYVFCGINNGYNVGFDIAYSGTLGAAFEAARHGIPAIAFSVAADHHLPSVEPYLLPVIQELLEADMEWGTVWNVNFPAMKTVGLKGILRDRTVAPVSMFTEKYIETKLPDGRVVLTCQGIPITNDQIPEGTDAKAVRNGYIAISKVKCTL
jgi:5'-nucleotidase